MLRARIALKINFYFQPKEFAFKEIGHIPLPDTANFSDDIKRKSLIAVGNIYGITCIASANNVQVNTSHKV